MKFATLAFLALVSLSWNASAQSRCVIRYREQKPEVQFGSVERSKLLKQVRGSQASEEVLNLGSVARRAILTGKKVQMPQRKPEHRTRRW